MFWFLRRTGATSFLNSFNSNTSKVASKSDKHISGAYKISNLQGIFMNFQVD